MMLARPPGRRESGRVIAVGKGGDGKRRRKTRGKGKGKRGFV